MKKTFLALCIAFTLAACSDDDFTPTLSTSVDEVVLPSNGESASFNIEANGNWSIETDGQTWYSISIEESFESRAVTSSYSGNGNCKVTVTFEPYTEAEGRSAQLTVRCEDLIRTIILTQLRPTPPDDPSVQSLTSRARGGEFTVSAPEGFSYKITIPEDADWITTKSSNEENITFQIESNTADTNRTAVIGLSTTDDISLGSVNVTQSWRNIEPGELLIEEIYFTSTALESTGAPDKYHGDQYYRLTNNCDETLYVDGVMIMESKINSTLNYEYEIDIKPEYAGVWTVYCIPGSGNDVSLDPGKSLIIANNAQNHASTNPNSMDLSSADFEWYDNSTVTSVVDIDNPDIKNLDIWFTYTLSIWALHDRGFCGHAIALPPSSVDKETFLANYKWEGNYISHTVAGDFDMQISNAYKVPNSWILDAVNLSIEEKFFTTSWDASLDAGWTYCGTVDKDATRYGKSVRRKTLDNGKLMDTNNSTNDFIAEATPSLKD